MYYFGMNMTTETLCLFVPPLRPQCTLYLDLTLWRRNFLLNFSTPVYKIE
jgi:hypothetical protein